MGLAVGIIALVVLLPRRAQDPGLLKSTATDTQPQAASTNASERTPIQSRGHHSASHSAAGTNSGISQFELASVADGDWILSFPLAEPQMTLRALTNSGIPLDRAKGLIRPILGYLYSAAAYKERVAHAESREIEELKRIRESDEYEVTEKAGLLTVTAAAYRASRESWSTQRDEKMEEFANWIRGLGVSAPEELMNDLLLIQPESMPPAPKPR
jgi:hypothetical protein